MNYCNIYNKIQLPLPLSEDEFIDYYRKFKKGDIDARDIIISRNLRPVIKIITTKFSETKYEIDELISIGNIALIKAVDTYNESKNKKFSTYASKCISNEILMLLRKDKNKPIVDSLDSPLIDEENEDLKLRDKLLEEIETLEDISIDKHCQIIINNTVDEILNSLEGREKDIIMMYFGFKNGKRYLQKEIGDKYNLTQSHIARIISKTLLKIKENILINIPLEKRSHITYSDYLDTQKVVQATKIKSLNR